MTTDATTARPPVSPMISWTEGSRLDIPSGFSLLLIGPTAILRRVDGAEWCDPDLVAELKAPTDDEFTAVNLSVAGFTATATMVTWTIKHDGPIDLALLKKAHDLIANELCK